MKICIEWSELYDGWLAKYDTETKEFEWRDHWAANELSKERKQELEQSIRNQYDNKTENT